MHVDLPAWQEVYEQAVIKALSGLNNTCLTHSNIHSDVTDRIPHLQEASYLGPLVNLHNKWVTFLLNLSANVAPRALHKFQSRILSFSSYCETQNRRLSKPGKGTRQGSGE